MVDSTGGQVAQGCLENCVEASVYLRKFTSLELTL